MKIDGLGKIDHLLNHSHGGFIVFLFDQILHEVILWVLNISVIFSILHS